MFGTNGRRIFAGAGIALALTMSATACGGGDTSVDKSALTQKMQKDKEFKGYPVKVIDCVRDVALKYGDNGKLNDYIKGKADFKDVVKSKDDKNKANKEVTKSCNTN